MARRSYKLGFPICGEVEVVMHSADVFGPTSLTLLEAMALAD